MNEMITINKATINNQEINTVNARELHEFLEVETKFSDWIDRRIREYGFEINSDFCTFLSKSSGGRPATEYHISILMAKELAMIEKNEKGKQARKYFIECERLVVERKEIDTNRMRELKRQNYAMQDLLLCNIPHWYKIKKCKEARLTNSEIGRVIGKSSSYVSRAFNTMKTVGIKLNPLGIIPVFISDGRGSEKELGISHDQSQDFEQS